MSIQHTLAANEAIVQAPGAGRRLSFLNHLATVKVPSEGGRSMSVVEFLAPRGFGPPEHRHNDEDELFVVMEGEIRYSTGGDTFAGPAGSIAYLPRAVPHSFQVVSDMARILNVTASSSVIPRFDEMVQALGAPFDGEGLPEPGPIDPAEVAAVCADHGIDVVGPPPPAL